MSAAQLDPQAAALLAEFAATPASQPGSTSSDTALSAAEKIAALRTRMAAISSMASPTEPVDRVEDITIPGPGGGLPIRVYVPHRDFAPSGPAPVLLYYHGGGFVAGNLEGYDTTLRAIANRGECIVVSVAYRLAPEHPYPAANEDAWTALQWVKLHAAEFDADPERLAVGGDSAGGLLAAWVAHKARSHGLSLKLQVLLYPNLDATVSKPSWRELGVGNYGLSLAQMLECYDAYLPSEIDRGHPQVSPLFTEFGRTCARSNYHR